MDVLTPEQRKKNMRRIRSKDTSIEIMLRKALWKKGYRYRKNYKALPGKPDIAITKYKIAIFCDSEFFHGKDWEIKKAKLLNSNNPKYWIDKIERNIARDHEIDQLLFFMEWTVIRFWGDEIKRNTDECIRTIEEAIFNAKIQSHDEVYNDDFDVVSTSSHELNHNSEKA